jgi:hypothetical protein
MQKKTSSVIYSGTRTKRIIFGICFAGVALYCDEGATQEKRALIQAGLWWTAPMVFMFIEARPVLQRTRLRYLSLLFLLIHTWIVYSVWVNKLPYESSLTVLFLALLEYLVLMIVMLRLGQEVDPKGPLGLTEAERQARTKPRLDN